MLLVFFYFVGICMHLTCQLPAPIPLFRGQHLRCRPLGGVVHHTLVFTLFQYLFRPSALKPCLQLTGYPIFPCSYPGGYLWQQAPPSARQLSGRLAALP